MKDTFSLDNSLFRTAFGGSWEQLPKVTRQLHEVQGRVCFEGSAQVERGQGWIARLVALFFGFPQTQENCPVRVTKTRTDKAEVWERDFGGHVMRSRCELAPSAGRFRERFGAFLFEMDLKVEDGVVHMPVRRAWCLGVPLPKFLLPLSETREFEQNGTFQFDVALYAPTGGLMVRYRGSLKPAL